MLSKATKSRLSRLLPLIVLALAALAAVGCTAAPSRGWSGPLVSDNILYVGNLQGKILALDLTTADLSEGLAPEMKWDPLAIVGSLGGGFTCGNVSKPMGMYGMPAVNNGRVYIGAYDGNVLYVTTNGEVSGTKFETGGPIIGGVVIDGDTLFVGSSDGKLYALTLDLKLKDGWPFKTEGKIWSTPVVDHGVVYIASADHNLYAIDAESGNEIWRFETEAAIMSTPLVANGKVYIGGCDRKFYSVDAAKEEERLAAAGGASPTTRESDSPFEGARNWFWTQALYYNGEIWVGSLDHKVYVLDAETLEYVTDISTEGMVYAPPVVMPLEGLVIVGSQDGRIYAINAATKDVTVYAIDAKTDEVFEPPDNKPKNPLSPILAPLYPDPDSVNGIVYLHAQDGTHTIYAIRLSADSAEVLWKFRTDVIK
jgi:outer membrane protein assembly factor BamB